jgi:hypothetical protein
VECLQEILREDRLTLRQKVKARDQSLLDLLRQHRRAKDLQRLQVTLRKMLARDKLEAKYQ